MKPNNMYAAPVSFNKIYNNMGFQDPLWPRSSVGTNIGCWDNNWWSPELVTVGPQKFGRRRRKSKKRKRKSRRKSKKPKRKSKRKSTKNKK